MDDKKDLEDALRVSKTKMKVPEFLPNLKLEVECLQETMTASELEKVIKHRQEGGGGLIGWSTYNASQKIFEAIKTDAEEMYKRELDDKLATNEIALELRCNICKETLKTALVGPDGFLYEAEQLNKYVRHHKWEAYMWQAPGSGARQLCIKNWRSPMTRQWFEKALFALSRTTHNVLGTVRSDIGKKFVREFSDNMQDIIHQTPMNTDDIAQMFCGDNIPRSPPLSPRYLPSSDYN